MTKDIEVLCHSSIKFNKENVIYIDPFKIDRNYSDADVIFITHDHYDHYSEEDIDKVKKESTVIVAPEDLHTKILKHGFNEEKIVAVKPNEEYELNGIKFETIPAYNKIKPFHPKGKGWIGYIVSIDGIRYYIAGDTDITKENENVKCDVAFVPVGGTYTMDYKEAAQLINKIKPKIAVPIHYGSIVGTKQDAVDFSKLLDQEIECKILMKSAKVIDYLDKLQENYQDLLPNSLQKSSLTEKDIENIEKELGYQLPKPYIEFLLSYQLPETLEVHASFCGDFASCYEPVKEDDLFVTLELEWNTTSSSTFQEFLSRVQEEDIYIGDDTTFLEAGFITVGEFMGYFVLLDLVTGKVVYIYHEEIYDMTIVDGANASNYEEVRDYMSNRILCEDFYDFLRLVCTKDIYDEDYLKFKTLEEIKKECQEQKEPSIEEENEIKEKAIEQVMATENMSREEAIQYLADLVQISVDDFNKE